MFEFKPFKIDEINIAQFCDMYNKCLGLEINKEYLFWKYEHNPAGKVVGFVALTNDKKIAGFYGVIPERFLINGKEAIVYQSMDTMTHPDFQKKGLFISLANKTYEEILKINPNALIIGIPGNNSFYGFVNKLNWNHIHSIGYVFLHKFHFSFLSKLKFLKVRLVSVFNNNITELNTFFENLKHESLIQQVYDFEFIKWRILNHPIRKYKLLTISSNSKIDSLLIYSIDSENRCIIDCYLTLQEMNMNSFVDYIFKNESVYWIYTWNNSIKSKHEDYSSVGFLKNPFNKGPFSYKIPFICFSESKDLSVNDINNYDLQPIIQD